MDGLFQLRERNISGNLSKGIVKGVPWLALLTHVQTWGRIQDLCLV